MAQGTGAAVHVGACVIESHIAHGRHGHDREGFVDLVEMSIRRLPSQLREQLLDGARGGGGEPLRLAGEARIAKYTRQWLYAAALRLGSRHEYGGGGAI